jgi:hypothetical protein
MHGLHNFGGGLISLYFATLDVVLALFFIPIGLMLWWDASRRLVDAFAPSRSNP